MSNCSTCGAPIRWARTAAGKSIPLDPDPDPAGNLIIDTPAHIPTVRYATPYGSTLFGDQATRWRSHFATCPNAERHRRPA